MYLGPGPSPEFIHLESGSGFNLCSMDSDPDFINGESRYESGFHSNSGLNFSDRAKFIGGMGPEQKAIG